MSEVGSRAVDGHVKAVDGYSNAIKTVIYMYIINKIPQYLKTFNVGCTNNDIPYRKNGNPKLDKSQDVGGRVINHKWSWAGHLVSDDDRWIKGLTE